MDYKDYYEILGVGRNADQDEIQRTYRKLARKYHPDINKDPGAEDKFKEVSEAYEVLKDAEKRQKYDQFGQAWKQAQQTGGGAPPGWEHVHFGGGGPGAERGGFDFEGFGASGFSEFFESLFGGGGRGGFGGFPGGGAGTAGTTGTWVRRGTDHEARLRVSLGDGYRGAERSLTLTDPETGERQTVRVRIPKGIRPGQKIRLSGKGGKGSGGGGAGDLLLKVEIEPHPVFSLDGTDLETTVDIAPWVAALGGRVEVPTLDGPRAVKVPAGSSSGRRIRLRGKGYPQSGGGYGDLFAELRIVVPDELTAEERRLFEELAETSSFDPGE